MSVQSAMYAGISGLNTNGEGMGVIGNNISNANTVGFKQGRAIFSDMLSTSLNQGQIGRGEQVQAVQNMFSQGSFENTGSPTDLAIQGNALFVLADSNGAGRYYSRAGAFSFDKNQTLTNPDGYQVLGFGITNGLSNGVLAPVNLTSFANVPPQATVTMGLVANLDATQTPPAQVWDPALPAFNPNLASNFSTSGTYYDAQGNAKSLTVYYRNTGVNTWEVNTYDGTTYTPAGAGTPVTFNANGSLSSPTTIATNGLTLDISGTTQYTNSSIIFSQTQDGFGAGNLSKVTVDDKGYVNGTYTNGVVMKIAQVGLARFASNEGLEKLGGSLYGETVSSGAALISASNTDNNKVLSNSLEQSNVDMADQLVKMIITQRAYTANSKTITTADQMMQDTLNLLR
ncbi:MAG: flagellar hook protein FlgE [Desulfobacteraceae bacterium]|nr:flagellar hook protein FlgE [Desulfobacteraceae bacterium]